MLPEHTPSGQPLGTDTLPEAQVTPLPRTTEGTPEGGTHGDPGTAVRGDSALDEGPVADPRPSMRSEDSVCARDERSLRAVCAVDDDLFVWTSETSHVCCAGPEALFPGALGDSWSGGLPEDAADVSTSWDGTPRGPLSLEISEMSLMDTDTLTLALAQGQSLHIAVQEERLTLHVQGISVQLAASSESLSAVQGPITAPAGTSPGQTADDDGILVDTPASSCRSGSCEPGSGICGSAPDSLLRSESAHASGAGVGGGEFVSASAHESPSVPGSMSDRNGSSTGEGPQDITCSSAPGGANTSDEVELGSGCEGPACVRELPDHHHLSSESAELKVVEATDARAALHVLKDVATGEREGKDADETALSRIPKPLCVEAYRVRCAARSAIPNPAGRKPSATHTSPIRNPIPSFLCAAAEQPSTHLVPGAAASGGELPDEKILPQLAPHAAKAGTHRTDVSRALLQQGEISLRELWGMKQAGRFGFETQPRPAGRPAALLAGSKLLRPVLEPNTASQGTAAETEGADAARGSPALCDGPSETGPPGPNAGDLPGVGQLPLSGEPPLKGTSSVPAGGVLPVPLLDASEQQTGAFSQHSPTHVGPLDGLRETPLELEQHLKRSSPQDDPTGGMPVMIDHLRETPSELEQHVEPSSPQVVPNEAAPMVKPGSPHSSQPALLSEDAPFAQQELVESKPQDVESEAVPVTKHESMLLSSEDMRGDELVLERRQMSQAPQTGPGAPTVGTDACDIVLEQHDAELGAEAVPQEAGLVYDACDTVPEQHDADLGARAVPQEAGPRGPAIPPPPSHKPGGITVPRSRTGTLIPVPKGVKSAEASKENSPRAPGCVPPLLGLKGVAGSRGSATNAVAADSPFPLFGKDSEGSLDLLGSTGTELDELIQALHVPLEPRAGAEESPAQARTNPSLPGGISAEPQGTKESSPGGPTETATPAHLGGADEVSEAGPQEDAICTPQSSVETSSLGPRGDHQALVLKPDAVPVAQPETGLMGHGLLESPASPKGGLPSPRANPAGSGCGLGGPRLLHRSPLGKTLSLIVETGSPWDEICDSPSPCVREDGPTPSLGLDLGKQRYSGDLGKSRYAGDGGSPSMAADSQVRRLDRNSRMDMKMK